MKILHVIEGLQKAAGTSVFCGEVLNTLARSGNDCRLLVRVDVREMYPLDERVKVVVGEIEDAFADGWVPDVVHTHGLWVPWLHRVCRYVRKRKIPIVTSPHGALSPWSMAHKRWKKLLPWGVYQRRDIAKTAAIHTTVPQESQWVRDLGFKNKIFEVPLGTELPTTLATYDVPVKYLLFVGRIYPVKGLDLLIQAWAKVKDLARVQQWKLLFVGPDQAGYMQVLQQLAVGNNLHVVIGNCDGGSADSATDEASPLSALRSPLFHKDADVVFMGPLYGADKDAAYRMSRALILPSYTENFGGVVVDAMSFGLPVLTSEATPWNFLEEYGCGEHFPLNVDALAEKLKALMAKSDDELKAMGRRGRKLVEERYSWDSIAKTMEEAYRELLQSN